MSILIEGMEMPKNCYGCPFFKKVDYWNKDDEADTLSKCRRTGEFTWESVNGYLPNCPLVPVPPHGRLIDENAIKAWFDEWYDPNVEILVWQLIEEIKNVPTVIEADKDGET